jgi:hypothetical protein
MRIVVHFELITDRKRAKWRWPESSGKVKHSWPVRVTERRWQADFRFDTTDTLLSVEASNSAPRVYGYVHKQVPSAAARLDKFLCASGVGPEIERAKWLVWHGKGGKSVARTRWPYRSFE